MEIIEFGFRVDELTRVVEVSKSMRLEVSETIVEDNEFGSGTEVGAPEGFAVVEPDLAPFLRKLLTGIGSVFCCKSLLVLISIFMICCINLLGSSPSGDGVFALFRIITTPVRFLKSRKISILPPNKSRCSLTVIGLGKKSESLLKIWKSSFLLLCSK